MQNKILIFRIPCILIALVFLLAPSQGEAVVSDKILCKIVPSLFKLYTSNFSYGKYDRSPEDFRNIGIGYINIMEIYGYEIVGKEYKAGAVGNFFFGAAASRYGKIVHFVYDSRMKNVSANELLVCP